MGLHLPSANVTVEGTMARSGFTLSRTLGILGIQRSWYYRQVDSGHITDGRFNTFAVRDDEWIVIGYKRRHPRMSHRESCLCAFLSFFSILLRYFGGSIGISSLVVMMDFSPRSVPTGVMGSDSMF